MWITVIISCLMFSYQNPAKRKVVPESLEIFQAQLITLRPPQPGYWPNDILPEDAPPEQLSLIHI